MSYNSRQFLPGQALASREVIIDHIFPVLLVSSLPPFVDIGTTCQILTLHIKSKQCYNMFVMHVPHRKLVFEINRKYFCSSASCISCLVQLHPFFTPVDYATII